MISKHEFNDSIEKVVTSIGSRSMADFIDDVDGLIGKYYPYCSESLGDTPSKLFLLKVSNLLIANYEMSHRRTTLISHPVGMLIDPSNSCALRCPGCVHSGKRKIWDWPPGLLKEGVFQSFIYNHAPFAIELYLANYGEPFLSPLTPTLVKSARSFGLPTFTSSSLSVPRKLIDGVVDSGLNFLICSIDGATSETYKKYRINGDFNQAIENLRFLVQRKIEINSYTPILHWQFLVFEHNRHEVDLVVKLARDIGANQIALAQPFDVSWDSSEVRPDPVWKSETIIFKSDSDVHKSHLEKMTHSLNDEVINRHFSTSWREQFSEISADDGVSPVKNSVRSCNWIYKSLTMDAHGRVMPCARPPSRSGDLIFGTHESSDTFNTEMHKMGRLFMANEEAYEVARGQSNAPEPYCVRCEHRDQKGDIDTEQTVRQILLDAPLYGLLSHSAVERLTSW